MNKEGLLKILDQDIDDVLNSLYGFDGSNEEMAQMVNWAIEIAEDKNQKLLIRHHALESIHMLPPHEPPGREARFRDIVWNRIGGASAERLLSLIQNEIDTSFLHSLARALSFVIYNTAGVELRKIASSFKTRLSMMINKMDERAQKETHSDRTPSYGEIFQKLQYMQAKFEEKIS